MLRARGLCDRLLQTFRHETCCANSGAGLCASDRYSSAYTGLGTRHHDVLTLKHAGLAITLERPNNYIIAPISHTSQFECLAYSCGYSSDGAAGIPSAPRLPENSRNAS